MMSDLDRKIAIYGCGGHARSILNAIKRNGYTGQVVLVDENARANEVIMGCPVVKNYELSAVDTYIMGIGDNARRQSYFDKIKKQSENGMTLIASTAVVGVEATVGVGTFVAENAYIGPCCEIGDNTIINTGSIVEHESVIGDHTHIAVGATVCGRCRIGNNVFCGAGSTVIDQISICDNVTIGAGSVVISDICEPGTYVGVPAGKIN